ncbi:MAG: histidine kinase [Anaerolineae bacterium]|nr:histidine kinase [Anaerolineae bacterium]
MTQDAALPTLFASPERSTPEELTQQAEQLAVLPLDILNAIPNICLVLNRHRQIVFANTALLTMLNVPDIDAVQGLRPGNVLSCAHASTVSGCGTTEFCRTCGAAQAILSSLGGKHAVEECRIVQQNGDALELRVSGTPYTLDNQRFSIFVLEDISHEKRRRVFERLFFHDVLNISGVLLGYSELLMKTPEENARTQKMKTFLYQATLRLIDEVKMQREISSAEAGDLKLQPRMIRSRKVLDSVRAFYQAHEVAQGRLITIDPAAADFTFTSDQLLIERVLGNLVKNALEASQPGQTVTLTCWQDASQDQDQGAKPVTFAVHNEGVMPRDVQLQLFQRSFSTKGEGRGIGSYSVKLFTERYLGGTVTFTSAEGEGTTFTVSYPKEWPEE